MKLIGNRQKNSSAGEKPKLAASAAAKSGRIALIAVLAVAAVILAGAAIGVSYVNRVNTIFPNVSVDGLDISGLTLSETAEKLAENGYGDLSGKSVSVSLPTDYTLTVNAEDVCTDTPVSDIALMAWDACKGGGAVGNTVTYLRCRFSGMELESGAAMTVDETAVQAAVDSAAGEVRRALLGSDLSIGEDSISVVKGAQGVEIDTEEVAGMIVSAFEEQNYTTLSYDAEIQPGAELDVQGIYDAVHTDSEDAYYDAAADEIVPETVGVSFDMGEARRLWNAASYGEEVYIPLILTEPEVTAASLSELLFRDRLSTMTTSLAGSSGNRINNVRRAAESINNVVLSPGEEFSYNPTLGERTKENGYLMAGAYSGGQTVQEYGGGICQVSSTLYYCTLYANLQITARTCHMFPVGYLPPGLDATVSWGGPEFKFVNDRDYPIRIEASVDEDGRSVTVELWGTDVDGSYVEMTYDTWYVFDTTYTSVCTGYKAQTYRSVFDKEGNLLSRKSEATSTYNYHQEDIAWPAEATHPETGDFPTDIELPEIVLPGGSESETPGGTDAPAETDPGTPSVPETPPETDPGTVPGGTDVPAEPQTPTGGQEIPPAVEPPQDTPPALDNMPAVELGTVYDIPQVFGDGGL